MKNIALLILLVFAFGCSDDDSPSPVAPVEYFYTISVKELCPGTSSTVKHCVTEQVYIAVRENISEYRELYPNEPCVGTDFPDITGTLISGFYITSDRQTFNPCAED